MSKISELSDGGSLVSTDFLIAVRSGGNVKVKMDTINVDQVDLGDNEFIRLGNSQDLTLVHNASNSIINQAGIGNLLIQKAGSTKLTINASGIDVTGTVTASGEVFIPEKLSHVGDTDTHFKFAGANDIRIVAGNVEHAAFDGTIVFNQSGSSTMDFRVESDTNENMLFVDASANRVGVGTNAPLSALTVKGTQGHWRVDPDSVSNEIQILTTTTANDGFRDFRLRTNETIFEAGGSERLRIDSTGNITQTSGDFLYSGNINWDIKHTGAGANIVFSTTPSGGSATEAARIDSSQNFLAGNTIANPASGFNNQKGLAYTFSSGKVEIATTADAPALEIGKNNANDGDLVSFRKQSNVVGSIGVSGGNNLFISGQVADHSGLTFATKQILPSAVGAITNGEESLGNSGARFQDLWLSGKIAKGTGGELDLRSDGGGFAYKQNLDVATAGATFTGQSTRGDVAAIRLYQTATGADGGYIRFDTCNSGSTTPSEKARLTQEGNLLVGGTSAYAQGATTLASGGVLYVSRNGGSPATFRRNSDDGGIVTLEKDGAAVGSIGSRATGQGVTFNSQAADGVLQNAGSDSYGWNTSYFYPRLDNAKDLGFASLRWDDVYATNATIQTSDRNEKQDIEELSDAEQRVAVAAKGLLRKFRWKSSVAEKGDEARTHFGIIAQDLQAAFEAEGLDAGNYAMFINSTWTDEETGEERSRMGVRYSELLAFIIAAI